MTGLVFALAFGLAGLAVAVARRRICARARTKPATTSKEAMR